MIDEFRHGDVTSVGMSAERLSVARDVALHWVASGETTGLVVLFARRGVVVWEEAFGLLTPTPDAPPMTTDALFPLASLTKPMMASAMMCLVEDGLIGLHRPLQVLSLLDDRFNTGTAGELIQLVSEYLTFKIREWAIPGKDNFTEPPVSISLKWIRRAAPFLVDRPVLAE